MKRIVILTEQDLVKLVKRVINEATIKPFNFDEYLDKLKMEEGNIETLEDVNDIFEGSSIYFSDFDEYFSNLKREVTQKQISTQLTFGKSNFFHSLSFKLSSTFCQVASRQQLALSQVMQKKFPPKI